MKVPTEAEVAGIIAKHKPGREYMAPVLAKWLVDHLAHPEPFFQKADRDQVNNAYKAAQALLEKLDQIGPDALDIVLAPFLTMRNPEVSPNPAEYQAPIIALAKALSKAGSEIDRRRLRSDAKTGRIAVTLAAWNAWDEGEPKDRVAKDGTEIKVGTRCKLPEGLRGNEKFIKFLSDLLGACGLPPQEAFGGYTAALEYLKNHR